MALLRVSNLRASYGAEAQLLSGISFKLSAGEHLGLSGASGAGKSTLLRLLSGLAVRESGLTWQGDVKAFGEHDILRSGPLADGRIGLVTEEPKAGLHPQRTLAESWRRFGLPPVAVGLLAEFGLENPQSILDRYPYQISGGEAQRYRLATALARNPRVLLLESPTASLDSVSTQRVLEVLEKRLASGLGIIHVSHDTDLLDRIATRRFHLQDGSLMPPSPAVRLSPKPQKPSQTKLFSAKHVAVVVAEKQAPLVDDVSLHIKKSEILGLAGRSGSGKTSLGRAIARLLPATGSAGFSESEKAYTLATHAYSAPDQRVQYLWQESREALNPKLTVKRTLSDALAAGRGRLSNGYKNAAELWEAVGMNLASLPRAAISLSTGEMLRLALARAIAVSPELLIADEILASLDATTRCGIVDLLRSQQRRTGLGILWIGHDLRQLQEVSDRIAVMDEGKIVETLSAEDFIVSARSLAARQLSAAAGLT